MRIWAVRPEGAAQVALIGPPNAGKSSLHVRLTESHAVVGQQVSGDHPVEDKDVVELHW